MNEKKPYLSRINLFLAVISVLLIVACDASVSQEAVPTATSVSNITTNPDPTATSTARDKVTPTAVFPTATAIIPTPTLPTPTETPAPQIYTVQEGDNLTIIADKFDATAGMIQRVNELTDGNAIYVGQELEIPMETAVVAALDDTVAERGILHNQILCPSAATIEAVDLEGGTIIGHSAVCQIPIVSYQLGNGERSLVIVGGVHGGYEWNTILLAYDLLDHFRLDSDGIPDSLSVSIIPNVNPDGLYAVSRRIGRFAIDDLDEDTVPGRFNGNDVDLNRNWDCEWTTNAVWRDNPVSGGSAPFSEMENQILRDFFLETEPAVVVFYHSAFGAVFASGCGQIDPASEQLTVMYSRASGYPYNSGFSQYVIRGDASNWLANQGIPAITVELTTHESLDWRMNLAGLKALIDHFRLTP